MIYRCWSDEVDFDAAYTFEADGREAAAIKFAHAEYRIEPFDELVVYVMDGDGMTKHVKVTVSSPVFSATAAQGLAEAVTTEGA